MAENCVHEFRLLQIEGVEGQTRTATLQCTKCLATKKMLTKRTDAEIAKEMPES